MAPEGDTQREHCRDAFLLQGIRKGFLRRLIMNQVD